MASRSNAQGVIAQGVRRLLLGQPPPPASTFGQRYLVFDGVLGLGSALGIWSLVRLVRRLGVWLLALCLLLVATGTLRLVGARARFAQNSRASRRGPRGPWARR